MSDTGLYLLFKQYCMAAGAGMYVTPHSARATAITKLLSDGVPHRVVQEFSRHASIQMVEWYDKRRFDVEQSPAKGLVYGKKKP
jgi:integrase